MSHPEPEPELQPGDHVIIIEDDGFDVPAALNDDPDRDAVILPFPPAEACQGDADEWDLPAGA